MLIPLRQWHHKVSPSFLDCSTIPTQVLSKLSCRPLPERIHYCSGFCAFRFPFPPPVIDVLLDNSCSNRNARQQWDMLSLAKGRILELVYAPSVNAGIRLAAVKFMQRAILVQTRGVADPRVSSCFISSQRANCIVSPAAKQERPESLYVSRRPSFHTRRGSGSRGWASSRGRPYAPLYEPVRPSRFRFVVDFAKHQTGIRTSSLRSSIVGLASSSFGRLWFSWSSSRSRHGHPPR